MLHNSGSFEDFEMSIAYHLAPAMLGIKPACLMSMAREDGCLNENIEKFNSKAAAKGLKLEVLCECKSRKLLFLYSEKLLSKQLADERVKALLGSFGYTEDMELDGYIGRLAERITSSGDFPHEVGLFLGYPVDDVTGFIENKGKNYLLCGYWKVYSDEDRARRIFDNYDKCRNYLCKKLHQGENIFQALKIS